VSNGAGRVAGKVALITGGGTGIGRAIAVRLVQKGADVVVISRTPEHVEETCDRADEASGRRPLSFPLDVSARAAVDRVVGQVAGPLRADRRPLEQRWNRASPRPLCGGTTDEEWEQLFRVNVTGAFYACRAALAFMPDGGSIVNMASINSFVAWENDDAYTATGGAPPVHAGARPRGRRPRDPRQLRLPWRRRHAAGRPLSRRRRRSGRAPGRVRGGLAVPPDGDARGGRELRPLPGVGRGVVRDGGPR
jgi:hypothetical protein